MSALRSPLVSELHTLRKRWDLDHYPNFLNSPALSLTSWCPKNPCMVQSCLTLARELMKLKLQSKILAAQSQPQTWFISFMGSSVTTGRAGFVLERRF